MKKLLVLVLISCLVFFSCGKKKQQEIEAKAKAERQVALKKIRNVKVNEAYIVNYVFENKENSVSVINVVQIPSGESVTFVYGGEEHLFKFKNSLWGIKKEDKIYLKEGYVKSSGVKFKLIPIIIEEFAETHTKEELISWITKYPLTSVIVLGDGTVYPVYHDLPDFLTNAKPGELITLRVKPTLSAQFKDQIYLFNSDYKQWTVRSE